MTSDDYELLPQQVIQDLKYEVEALKKRLSAPDAKINELILELESMKESIHDLHSIFTQALAEVKSDDNMHVKKLDDTGSKIDILMQQNETIAKGMIAIADKVDDFISKQNKMNGSYPAQPSYMPQNNQSPNPAQINMGMPPLGGMSAPSRMAPPPSFGDMPPLTPSSSAPLEDDFPPPPPGINSAPKRRGLFK